jgi:hypothetical protein
MARSLDRLHPFMSFNENEVVRATDGKFAEKTGASPEVALDADIPGPQNGFLLPGRECECDVDYHCSNHDTEAEAAYYAGIVGNADPDALRTTDAHGFDDRWDD